MVCAKGNSDEIVHVGPLGNDIIREYISSMYPEYNIPKDIAFRSEVGCNVQAAFFESNGDAKKMVDLLKDDRA